jgi:hypothetical protein
MPERFNAGTLWVSQKRAVTKVVMLARIINRHKTPKNKYQNIEPNQNLHLNLPQPLHNNIIIPNLQILLNP